MLMYVKIIRISYIWVMSYVYWGKNVVSINETSDINWYKHKKRKT